MARGGFDYSEFRELYQSVKEMSEKSRRFIEDFLTEMALEALAATKKRTPVDTGDLRAQWKLSAVIWRGNQVMINLVNDKLYASFEEFGHWQRPGRFVPGYWNGRHFVYQPGYRLDGKLSGMVLKKSWVPGKFMMTTSVEEVERRMPARLQAAWKQFATGYLGR